MTSLRLRSIYRHTFYFSPLIWVSRRHLKLKRPSVPYPGSPTHPAPQLLYCSLPISVGELPSAQLLMLESGHHLSLLLTQSTSHLSISLLELCLQKEGRQKIILGSNSQSVTAEQCAKSHALPCARTCSLLWRESKGVMRGDETLQAEVRSCKVVSSSLRRLTYRDHSGRMTNIRKGQLDFSIVLAQSKNYCTKQALMGQQRTSYSSKHKRVKFRARHYKMALET